LVCQTVARRQHHADFQFAEAMTAQLDAVWFERRKSAIDPVRNQIVKESFRRVLNG
jgi:hypothetical protein